MSDIGPPDRASEMDSVLKEDAKVAVVGGESGPFARFLMNLRFYLVYWPIFTALNLLWIFGLLIFTVGIFFPKPAGAIIWSGGPYDRTGSMLLVVAALPLAMVCAKAVLWLIVETDVTVRKQKGLQAADAMERAAGAYSRKWFLAGLLWIVAFFPVVYDHGSRYIHVGNDTVLIGTGPFDAQRRHTWDDLREIRSACKAGADGKTFVPSYAFVFEGGDVASVSFDNQKDIDDFMNDWRGLIPILKGHFFQFTYDGDSSCPTRWLPVLSVRPGDTARPSSNH
jgi:hypothetical protein